MKLILMVLMILAGMPGLKSVYADDAKDRGEEIKFVLEGADIMAWEESGEGKYIYFTVVKEKGDELEKIASGHDGDILVIVLDGKPISRAIIKSPIRSDVGFALSPAEDQRADILALLDPAKKVDMSKLDMGVGAGAKVIQAHDKP